MRSLVGQRGMSSVSWIALLLVVAFAVTVAIRIVPAYIDYYSVLNAAKSVQQEPALADASPDELRDALRTRMRINDVDDLGEDVIAINPTRAGTELLIDYEVRRWLVGNIDLVLRFNRRIGPEAGG